MRRGGGGGALDRLLGGAAGGSGAQAAGTRRQKRGDVLDALGDFGGAASSISKINPGARRPTGSGKTSATPANVAPREALVAPILALSGSTPGKTSTVPATSVSAESRESLQVSAAPAVPASSTVAAGPVVADGGNNEARQPAAVSSGSSEGPLPTADAPAEVDQPARITEENLDRGWRTAFSKARNAWHVDEDGCRGVYWHADSGCCFEWDQAGGILLQYIENWRGGDAAPRRVPVWSVEAPDENTWIWEQLPLPPTDPAALPDEDPEVGADMGSAVAGTNDNADASDQCSELAPKVGGDTGVNESSCSGDSSSSAMPPPALPPCKRPSKAGDDMMLPPPAPKKTKPPRADEVLDDNAWERRCALLEQRANSKESSPDVAASKRRLRSECGLLEWATNVGPRLPDSNEAGVGLKEQPTIADFDESLGPALSDVGAGAVASCQPRPFRASGSACADEDEDMDEEIDQAGPLAADGDPTALPAAPVGADKAKPKACDLDLDIFGAPPEEDDTRGFS